MLKLGGDIPTLGVLEFFNKLFSLLRNKMIQQGFSHWKQIGVLKSAKYLLEVVKISKKDNMFVFSKIIIENYTNNF